jgi:hypothetical protein
MLCRVPQDLKLDTLAKDLNKGNENSKADKPLSPSAVGNALEAFNPPSASGAKGVTEPHPK